jgi:uncharacterized repeat protein (TIGR03803 family)
MQRTVFRFAEALGLLVVLFVGVALAAAQTLKTVYTFETTGPYGPYANVVQGLDGNLYGTTAYGGTNGQGTVYRLTPEGKFSTIYSFCSLADCADGAAPNAPVVLGTDGNFYGTTLGGGTGTVYCGEGCGTIFKLTPKGVLTTLHNFCTVSPCDDGSQPDSGLVQGGGGDFYGVTPSYGGSYLQGTVYKITPSGTFTALYAFCQQNDCTDGEMPRAPLIQGTNGMFYGTTEEGGANGYGEIFEIGSTPGTPTILHSFDKTDGQAAFSRLLQASNGNFYGMTQSGGTNTCALGYLCGTLYELTPSRMFSTLFDFDSTDGSNPVGGFVQAGDGNLYGAAGSGGSNDGGTIFKMTTSGTLTTLYNFCANPCVAGNSPAFGIFQATNGLFYGIADSEEEGNLYEIVFSFEAPGLKPFITTLPTSGKVGASVRILGNNLTGATAVSFNGTSQPTFTVVSATEITTTVPTGATSGKVEVTTPSGTLSTVESFRVP